MRIHCLQHVPFEDMATIETWARERGHDVSRTLLFRGEALPELAEFDWLVIMGGPMNVNEEERYPWLAMEKRFVKKAIDDGKMVLGICLGAQLIADILGGRVRKNEHREIGWYPVTLTQAALRSEIFGVLPERFIALHWHGDTFDLPPGAVWMARSEACAHQAFQIGRAIGLQFHLEASMDSIDDLVRNCSGELEDGVEFIQNEEEILAGIEAIPDMNELMARLLDEVEKRYGF